MSSESILKSVWVTDEKKGEIIRDEAEDPQFIRRLGTNQTTTLNVDGKVVIQDVPGYLVDKIQGLRGGELVTSSYTVVDGDVDAFKRLQDVAGRSFAASENRLLTNENALKSPLMSSRQAETESERGQLRTTSISPLADPNFQIYSPDRGHEVLPDQVQHHHHQVQQHQTQKHSNKDFQQPTVIMSCYQNSSRGDQHRHSSAPTYGFTYGPDPGMGDPSVIDEFDGLIILNELIPPFNPIVVRQSAIPPPRRLTQSGPKRTQKGCCA